MTLLSVDRWSRMGIGWNGFRFEQPKQNIEEGGKRKIRNENTRASVAGNHSSGFGETIIIQAISSVYHVDRHNRNL